MRSTSERSTLRSVVLMIAVAGAASAHAADPSTAGASPNPHIVVKPWTFKAEVSDACHLRVSGMVKPPNISWKVALVRNTAGDFNENIYTLALAAPEPQGRQSRTQHEECVVYSAGNGRHSPSTTEICKLKQVVVTGGDRPITLDVRHPLGRTDACRAAPKG